MNLEDLKKKLKVVKSYDMKKVAGGKQSGSLWSPGCGGIIPL